MEKLLGNQGLGNLSDLEELNKMTELLYLHDSYIKEFDACVKEVSENKVVLDRSAFYPGSGGQPCDTGKVFTGNAVFSVTDVRNIDDKYTIILDKPGLVPDTIVKCRLDWERRHVLMRMHTTAHIISSIIFNRFNAKITGNQLNLEKSRIDFNAQVTKEHLPELERMVNEEILKNHEVEVSFQKRKDISNIEEMSKLAKGIPEHIEVLRLVRIGEIDMQFDGGTHVKNTKEIGQVRLLDLENKGKDNKRIYFSLSDPNGGSQ